VTPARAHDVVARAAPLFLFDRAEPRDFGGRSL